MSVEEWRTVPGYEGAYEVSDLGRVRSIARRNARGRILTPEIRPSGHLRVKFSHRSIERRFWVHHLVLMVFVGPRPEGMEACHNDGNPANNRPANLRWDTKSANARDRQRHGTDRQTRKDHCPKDHPYSPENTYTNAKGWRRCRTCTLDGQRAKKKSINAARRKRYARRKAA